MTAQPEAPRAPGMTAEEMHAIAKQELDKRDRSAGSIIEGMIACMKIALSRSAQSLVGDGALGTFACPICGLDKPHHHADEVVGAYRADEIRNDGWISYPERFPEREGPYLVKDFSLVSHSLDAEGLIKAYSPAWGNDQLIVGEWHRNPFRFSLPFRVPNRFGEMQSIFVTPKFWREIPTASRTSHPQPARRSARRRY